MNIRRALAFIGLLSVTAVVDHADAQRVRQRGGDTVLFVCEHGTVKSLLAKLLFERLARDAGLKVTAVSRGTKADSAVPAWMQQGLMADRVTLGSWKPRTLQRADLSSASLIISFDIPDSAFATGGVPRARWDDTPSVSKDYAKGRDAIERRVRLLVDSLKRAKSM